MTNDITAGRELLTGRDDPRGTIVVLPFGEEGEPTFGIVTRGWLNLERGEDDWEVRTMLDSTHVVGAGYCLTIDADRIREALELLISGPAARAGAALTCAADMLGLALEAWQDPDLEDGTALAGWDPHLPSLEDVAAMLRAVRVVVKPRPVAAVQVCECGGGGYLWPWHTYEVPTVERCDLCGIYADDMAAAHAAAAALGARVATVQLEDDRGAFYAPTLVPVGHVVAGTNGRRVV